MNTLFSVQSVPKPVRAQDSLGPWVNRDQRVICSFNGNEGCLREDITAIPPCVMF